MMRYKFADNKAVRVTLLCSLLYFCSYLTRYNFGAVLVEIASHEGISDKLLSMSVMGLFITYGIGQVVSGFLGDKIRPQYVMAAGLFTSAVMNILIPFCKSPWAMLVIWCINGFAQAMLWPPLVRILATELNQSDYKQACFLVSCASSLGTISVYLLSPLCISIYGWRLMFWVSGTMALLMTAAWLIFMRPTGTFPAPVEINMDEKNTESEKPFRLGALYTFMLIAVMVAIAAQGAVRDGITTWMPTLMSEAFNLKTTVSILTGVVLPIFAIISFRIATEVNRRFFPNDVTCAGVMFLISTAALLVMYFSGLGTKLLCVIMLMFTTGGMHGVNLMLISMLPQRFKKFGKVSFATGMLNTCTYVGSAASSFGIAVFKDKFGWDNTVLLWAGIALLGFVCCMAGRKLFVFLTKKE